MKQSNSTDSDIERSLLHHEMDNINKLPSFSSGGTNARLNRIAWLITISSFGWGYSMSVLNVCIVENAKGSILNDLNPSIAEQELATAMALISAWIGSICANFPTEGYGRKVGLLWINFFYIVGAILGALATTKHLLYLSRFFFGLASGGVTTVVPVLLTEISSTGTRGQITTLHQLQLTIGILASGLLGYLVIQNIPSGWRLLNALMAIPPILQCIASPLIPESPRWLIKVNQFSKAREILEDLRTGSLLEAIEQEHNEMILASRRSQETGGKDQDKTWSQLYIYRKPIFMGTCLVFFQAMTGVNSVIFYSSKIFAYAGVNHPIAATASVGTINVLMTVVSISLVDSYGRRKLLILGTSIMTLALLLLSGVLLEFNSKPTLQGIVAVGATLLYISGFAIGLGAVVWVILGEILPTSVRTRAMSFFMAINYLCNIFIATCTLSIIQWLGHGHANPEKQGMAKFYLICSAIAVVAVTYIVVYVPETKDSVLDQPMTSADAVSYSTVDLEDQDDLVDKEAQDDAINVATLLAQTSKI